MGVITFNGRSSDEFGCVVSERPNHARGSRLGEVVEIPGRNTALALEYGSYSTYTQAYQVSFKEGSDVPPYKRAAQVAEWLLGSSGFCRLEDSFEPDCYRLARYAGPLNIDQVASEYGSCTLEFVCLPQRFLKIGEGTITFQDQNGYKWFELTPLPIGAESVSVKYAESNTLINLGLANLNARNDILHAQETQTDDGYEKALDIAEDYRHLIISFYPDAPFCELSMVLNGERVPLVDFESSYYRVYNPTPYSSLPLVKVEDARADPLPVVVYREYGTAFTAGGNVIKDDDYSKYTSKPIDVSSSFYAVISGTGYSFFDSTQPSAAFSDYDYGKSLESERKTTLSERKILVPQGADTLVVSGDATVTAEVSLKADQSQAGVGAITIGSTSVNVDLSTHDEVTLDSELHDAYYADGSSANLSVSFEDPETEYPTFPAMQGGENLVYIKRDWGVIVELTPRWWRL